MEKYNFDWENVKTVEDMYPLWDAIRDNEKGIYPVGDLSIQAFEDDYFSEMGPRSSSAFGKTRESCQKQKRHDMSAPVRAQPGKESVPASRIKSCDTTKFISKHSNEGKIV